MKQSAIVDAMFGAGLSRPLRDEALRAAGLLNTLRKRGRARPRIIAVDVPSGMHGDLGEPLASASEVGECVHADETVCLTAMKAGLLTPAGRRNAGKVSVARLPIARSVEAKLLREAGAKMLRKAGRRF